MEFDRQHYLKLMEQQDWEYLRVMLLQSGPAPNGWKIKDRGLREEYVSKAIEKVYMGDQAWSPEKGTIALKLRQVLWSVISNDLRRAENETRAADIINEDGTRVNPIDIEPDDSLPIDEALESKQIWATVVKMNEEDEIARNVLVAFEMEPESQKELSELTGYSIETVRNALKRIRRRYKKEFGD